MEHWQRENLIEYARQEGALSLLLEMQQDSIRQVKLLKELIENTNYQSNRPLYNNIRFKIKEYLRSIDVHSYKIDSEEEDNNGS